MFRCCSLETSRPRLLPQSKRMLSFKPNFPGGSDSKESASNMGDPGSIPGSGISPGEGNATYSSILAWEIPWTEKPGRLQSMDCRVGHD